MKKVIVLALALAFAAAFATLAPKQHAASVLAAAAPMVSIDTDNTGPRKVEDSTQKAVTRDYAAAWQDMADALDENRADLLNTSFIGTAREKLAATIAEQRKAGLHQRIIDKGHHVEAVFYSPEGSALELHDSADLELQLLDGSRVVRAEDTTVRYVALLTAAENSWKVRVLEAVPSF